MCRAGDEFFFTQIDADSADFFDLVTMDFISQSGEAARLRVTACKGAVRRVCWR